jgi:hypothetical protein
MIDRPALRRRYEAGISATRSAEQMNIHHRTATRWYLRWLREDGDKAPRCGCGRSLVHQGRCRARSHERLDWFPPYRGPAWIGKPMTAEEAEKVAR